jgi:hypothetical protein
MFNRQNSGAAQLQRQRPNVNTTLHTFYNNVSPMSFSVALWNDKISLSWIPALGVDANGLTKYDWQHRVNSALSVVKCAALVKKYNEKLKQYVEGDETIPEGGKSIGVLVGGNQKTGVAPGAFVITAYTTEDGKKAVAASLVRNVNGQQSVMTFEFGSTQVLIDYDPTNGEQMVSEDVNDFGVFLRLIDSYALMVGMVNHEGRFQAALNANRGGGNGNFQPAQANGAPSSNDFLTAGFNGLENGMEELPFA